MSIRSNIPKLYALSCIKNMMFFGAVAVPFFIDWAARLYPHVRAGGELLLLDVHARGATGVVADRYGRKYSLALGCLFAAVSLPSSPGERLRALFLRRVHMRP